VTTIKLAVHKPATWEGATSKRTVDETAIDEIDYIEEAPIPIDILECTIHKIRLNVRALGSDTEKFTVFEAVILSPIHGLKILIGYYKTFHRVSYTTDAALVMA
jgi:hypothetical protein